MTPEPAEVTPQSPPQPSRQIPLPMMYFNGFAVGVGTSDFTLVLHIDNRPIAELKTSFTVGKTLAEKLSGVVEQFQKMTDHNIMTTDDVNKGISKLKAEGSNA